MGELGDVYFYLVLSFFFQPLHLWYFYATNCNKSVSCSHILYCSLEPNQYQLGCNSQHQCHRAKTQAKVNINTQTPFMV